MTTTYIKEFPEGTTPKGKVIEVDDMIYLVEDEEKEEEEPSEVNYFGEPDGNLYCKTEQ